MNISKNIKTKKNKTLEISGFISNLDNIYATTNLGHLLKIESASGKLEKIIRVSKRYLSRPFYNNQNIYLVSDNAVIRFN